MYLADIDKKDCLGHIGLVRILCSGKSFFGGCSSGVESQIVDLVVAGSKPVIHLLRWFMGFEG